MTKILVITHDHLLARAYGARLAKEGFDVACCPDGHGGLIKARQWNPELIVLDLWLPGMHGLDVLKWLRDVPWLAQVPVLLLIERSVPGDILQECRFWGAVSCFEKARGAGEFLHHLQAICSAPTSSPALP